MRARRLLIWRAGEVIRGKLARLGNDWDVVRFAPPFKSTRGLDTLIDAAAPLPCPDAHFTAVYARRILEHLAPDEAALFAQELRRIVTPGGVVRVSVPDTEALARSYLHAAERARRAPVHEAVTATHHARLMLLDQFVRRVPGGALAAEIAGGRMPGDIVRAAFGDALGIDHRASGGIALPQRPKARQRLKEAARLLRGRRWVNETHANREAHLWIWDRYSLPRLLLDAGFTDLLEANAAGSAIADWARLRLDVSERGPHDFEPSYIVEARYD